MSKIFTKAEVEEIERRDKGDFKDKQGLFSARIKPKIIEILDLYKRRKWLMNLIKPKKRGRRK